MADLQGQAPPSLVVTRTPLRISFAGGGTDLPAFYERQDGTVYSTTINRYVYVTVKRHGEVFDERIRLNYSTSESVHEIDAIRNNIAREALRLLDIDPPIYVSVVSDLPDSSGLGGSSSFAVGLLNALHVFRGERVAPRQLAEEASFIEMDVLREPIGKQDQYAAAFGGLNLLRFCANGEVHVQQDDASRSSIDELFNHVLMLWTGHQRRSSSVLTEQRERTAEHIGELSRLHEYAYVAQRSLANGSFDPVRFGRMLDETWRLKRSLASTVTNDHIDGWYDAAMRAGAHGGKLCGAGGGGFLLFVADPQRHRAIVEAVGDLSPIRVGYEATGSSVLLPTA